MPVKNRPRNKNGIVFSRWMSGKTCALMRAMREKYFLSDFHQLMSFDLYTISGTPITVGRLLVSLLALLVAWLISLLARRSIARIMKRKGVKNEQTVKTTCSFVHWFILIGGCVVALKIAGIDLSTLFAAGAVLTVGLGFAMQNIAQNFVSGVILFAERSIQPGDILSVDGTVVKILKIGIRSTLAITRNMEEMIIPNSNLVQGTVTNYTMSDTKHLLGTFVGVTYDSDMKKVKEVLQEVAESMPWRVEDGRASVLMRDFGDSAVNFSVFVEVTDPWRSRVLASELNEAIWWALKANNIVIAFPQLDVHFDKAFYEKR
ncbi:MAG: mechanosensitive ion channel [Deltaproteobacteria bacterium]|nr:mechanosensitive ion channel [Deltaproteobacteria bacterium]